MGFHTFETSYQISPLLKSSIKDALYNCKGGKTYVDKKEVNTIVCEALRKHGIIIKQKTIEKGDFTYYMLYYKINPRRVMDAKNFVGIFNYKDVKPMIEKVNSLIVSIGNNILPTLDQCNLNRIDICSNIQMSGQAEINAYIEILNRGMIPDKYQKQKYYDEKAKKLTPSKSGATFTGEHGIEVTYYNKYRQLQSESIFADMERANKIIRAEIRCKKKKVKHLCKKYDVHNIEDFLLRTNKICVYIFNEYANVFYGAGDFYKLKEVNKRINASSFKSKSKKMMRELAKDSATFSSLDKAVVNFKRKYGKKELQKTLERFDKIKVSPVIISRRCDYNYFPNPLALAKEWAEYD